MISRRVKILDVYCVRDGKFQKVRDIVRMEGRQRQQQVEGGRELLDMPNILHEIT